MKKSLFYSVAIAAALASCTQEAIEVVDNNVQQDLSIRPTLGEIVLVENTDVESRFAAGNGAQPVFSEGDKLGAAIMDAPLYPNTPYNEEDPAANYSIVEYYSSNSAFTYDGNAWYLNEDQPLVEGNYMFYAPYNAAMQFRTPFEVAIPAKQAASTEKAALDEFYASGAIVRIGYQFLAAEGGAAQKPKVTMNDVFAYPMFTIKNNFEGYLQSLEDEEGNITVSSYKGALKVDSIKLVNGSNEAIVVGGVLSNQGAATTMAEEWSVSPMANFTAQLLSENNQVEVAAGEVITTLVAGGREIAQGESAKFYAVMPAVKFGADELQAKVYVTVNNKPYVIKTATAIAWSGDPTDPEDEAVPSIGGTIEDYVSYATTTGPVTLIKGQRFPQEEVNFINGSLSAKSIAGNALTLDLTGGLLDSEDANDALGSEEAVLFAQEIPVTGEEEGDDEGEETDYIDNNTEFIAFIANRENGTNYVENSDDFVFAENTTAQINSEMIDALFAYNNKGAIKIEKSLIIANDVEVVAIVGAKVTFESTNGNQYTIEFGTENYSTANNIVNSGKSVHVLKEGTWTINASTTLNNVKNHGIMNVNSHLSATSLVNDSVMNVTSKITKGFENNGTVNVKSNTAYIIVNAGVGEIKATPTTAAATVSVTGGTQTGVCTLTDMDDIKHSSDNAITKTWINEWELTAETVAFTLTHTSRIPSNRAITFHIISNNVVFQHGAAQTFDMKNMTLCLEGDSDMTITGDHVELTTVKNVTIKNETNYQVTLNNIAMGDAETASATYVGLEGGLVADGINATWNGAAIGVNAEEALIAALAEGGEVKLMANITTTSGLYLDQNVDVTIDLNGYDLVVTDIDEEYSMPAIYAKSGTLTIKGEGTIRGVIGSSDSDAEASVPAVFADGDAVVNIMGGNFSVPADNDCIYVYSSNAKVNIYGGVFEAGTNGNVLNQLDDVTDQRIFVYGGTFKNYNPAYGDNSGTPSTFLASGCNSTLVNGSSNDYTVR